MIWEILYHKTILGGCRGSKRLSRTDSGYLFSKGFPARFGPDFSLVLGGGRGAYPILSTWRTRKNRQRDGRRRGVASIHGQPSGCQLGIRAPKKIPKSMPPLLLGSLYLSFSLIAHPKNLHLQVAGALPRRSQSNGRPRGLQSAGHSPAGLENSR